MCLKRPNGPFFFDLQRLREVPIDFSDHLGLSKNRAIFSGYVKIIQNPPVEIMRKTHMFPSSYS